MAYPRNYFSYSMVSEQETMIYENGNRRTRQKTEVSMMGDPQSARNNNMSSMLRGFATPNSYDMINSRYMPQTSYRGYAPSTMYAIENAPSRTKIREVDSDDEEYDADETVFHKDARYNPSSTLVSQRRDLSPIIAGNCTPTRRAIRPNANSTLLAPSRSFHDTMNGMRNSSAGVYSDRSTDSFGESYASAQSLQNSRRAAQCRPRPGCGCSRRQY